MQRGTRESKARPCPSCLPRGRVFAEVNGHSRKTWRPHGGPWGVTIRKGSSYLLSWDECKLTCAGTTYSYACLFFILNSYEYEYNSGILNIEPITMNKTCFSLISYSIFIKINYLDKFNFNILSLSNIFYKYWFSQYYYNIYFRLLKEEELIFICKSIIYVCSSKFTKYVYLLCFSQ